MVQGIEVRGREEAVPICCRDPVPPGSAGTRPDSLPEEWGEQGRIWELGNQTDVVPGDRNGAVAVPGDGNGAVLPGGDVS